MMPNAGDVVTVDFPGAQGVKRRPAVVLSSAAYHAERPDMILGVLTTNVGAARTSMDHLLRDWQQAGLRAVRISGLHWNGADLVGARYRQAVRP